MRAALRALAGALREVWGLFVEDGSFTVAILVCVALALFALPRLPVPGSWRGVLLFVLLAAALLENVHRTARRNP